MQNLSIGPGSILGHRLFLRFESFDTLHSLFDNIAPPVATWTRTALLSYVSWIESGATFLRHASNSPRDRANDIVQVLVNIQVGPTLEDIVDFHWYPVINNTRFVEDLEEDLFSENGSKLYDEDWSRLDGCNLKVLRDGNSPLRGTVFKFGSTTGSWAGSNYYFVFYQSYVSHKPRRLHSMSRWPPCWLGHNRTR